MPKRLIARRVACSCMFCFMVVLKSMDLSVIIPSAGSCKVVHDQDRAITASDALFISFDIHS